jgi:hypothetical protein
MKSESVKIDGAIVRRIRRHIKSTGQTISGFININLDKVLTEEERLKRSMEAFEKLNNK